MSSGRRVEEQMYCVNAWKHRVRHTLKSLLGLHLKEVVRVEKKWVCNMEMENFHLFEILIINLLLFHKKLRIINVTYKYQY